MKRNIVTTYRIYANIFHENRKLMFLFEQRIENVPFFLILGDEALCTVVNILA
jgi:hypothetical protein